MSTIKVDSVTDQSVLDASTAKFTPEGFMNVTARLARTGIQLYSTDEESIKSILSELPAELRLSGKIVRMLRPENEVFSADSLASIAQKPVTNNHPPKNISARDAKHYMIGVAGKETIRDNDYIKNDLTIYDEKTIEEIKGGKKEISLGYSSDWNMVSGIDEKFGVYDGIMSNIRTNHIAIVQSGRAGTTVKILDKEGVKMAERTIGNVKLEIADDKVGVIDAVILDAEKAKKELADSVTAIDALKKTVDTLTGEKDALSAKVKDSVLSAEALDAMVKTRTDLIANAKRLHAKIVTDGKSNVDIMKGAILERTKTDCADKSVDYVTAAFDTLVSTTVSDSASLAASLADNTPTTNFEKSREKFIESNKVAFEASKKGA